MYKLITESDRIPTNFTGIVERDNGDKYWLKEGKWHRLDGPAREYANGTKEWWVEGKQFSEKEFINLTQKTCEGKLVEVDGKKYRLVSVD